MNTLRNRTLSALAVAGTIGAYAAVASAEAECFVEDEINGPVLSCIAAGNQLLAQVNATGQGLRAWVTSNATEVGMFGFDSGGDWIPSCYIIEGPGTYQTQFSECPGLVSYTFYGNNDWD